MEANLSRYDQVLYPSYSHPQTHPDRLAVVSRLFGLQTGSVGGCRVLELGCGNGANLVPMAWGLPGSEFLGIDLAGEPIAQGDRMITDLGLSNVRLVHSSITEIDERWGAFDYIIAHGFYSWVPTNIQERLLAICHERLSAQGVAFVSYNALPGGHLRNMLREMMLFHVRGCEAPEARIKQAVALVRFLAEGHETGDEYGLWMRAELDRIIEHAEGHLYHDELGEINQPLYFAQFMEKAAAHGLAYVGEADYFEMSDHIFSESVRQTLQGISGDRLLREQYLDFLKCRRFRQTLLCHRQADLRREPDPNAVAKFLICSVSQFNTGSADLRSGVNSAFASRKGSSFETDFGLGKRAFAIVADAHGFPVPFEELFERANAGLGNDGGSGSREDLCGFLLRLYAAGMVEFRTSLPPITSTATERPMASPVARWQLEEGNFVTSGFHMTVKVEDEIGRWLLSSLDGTADRKALLQKVEHLLKSSAPSAQDSCDRTTEEALENNLQKIARLGLLVG
jgi:SAM-dependent methyltransferase